MKWQRLWQPRRMLFWQMVAFNILSSLCSWVLRTLPLNGVGVAVVGLVALANVAFGLVAAWALLKLPAPDEVQPPEPPAASGPSASTSE